MPPVIVYLTFLASDHLSNGKEIYFWGGKGTIKVEFYNNWQQDTG